MKLGQGLKVKKIQEKNYRTKIIQFLVLLSFTIPHIASAEFKPLDPDLKDFPYPHSVYYFTQKIQHQDLKMAYMDITPSKSNGQVVVLNHGKNFSGNYWDMTIKSLSDLGFRVIVPDQIGFGKSTKPDHLQYSFHLLAKMTFNLLDSLKVKNFFLVGHSMGGMLSTRMALISPERVTKLVLVNPIGLEDWKTIVPYQSVDEVYQNELQQTEDKIRAYQKASYFDGEWKPEYENQIAILAGWTKHPDYKKVAWNAALTAEMIMTQPVYYEFKNLKVSTLLIIGTRDKTALGKNLVDEKTRAKMGDYSKLGKATAKLIPKSKLVEIPKVGHMPQVEAYDTYIKVLKDFLL